MKKDLDEKRRDLLQRIRRFRLMDDEFMTKCFEDNIECTELVLRIVMDRADDMNYGKLSERVRYFKTTEEGVKAMSKAMEELAKKWAEEEIRERNEEVALELIHLGRMEYEEIAKISKLSVETVEKLAKLQPV